MKLLRYFIASLLFFPTWLFAANATACFIIADNEGTTVQQMGDCNDQYTPASTFKIALALMGFDSGILKSPTDPVWPYKPEYPSYMPSWAHDQDPRSWIENSVVWYSQLLTAQLGMEKFQAYVDMFDYGNKDLSGDPGKHNGLTNAWLGSSLKISPEEQVMFLKKLVHHEFKLSSSAYTNTIDVLQRGTVGNDWKLYGKTGSAAPLGWFVGWVEKNDKRYLFVYLRRDEPKRADPLQQTKNRVDQVKTMLAQFLKNKTPT